MIDNNSLNRFVGAEVLVANPLNCPTQSRGKIVQKPFADEEYELITLVMLEDGSKKLYQLKKLRFSDATLQQKAIEICAQMLAIKKLVPIKYREITIGDKTYKIANAFHSEFMADRPIMAKKEIEEKFGVYQIFYNGNWHFKGINISESKSSIILISVLNMEDGAFVYHDHWTKEGDYIFSGEGKNGDQDPYFETNAAILNSKVTGARLYLFIGANYQYIYQGEFVLYDYDFEEEPGEDGKRRQELKFTLKKCSSESSHQAP